MKNLLSTEPSPEVKLTILLEENKALRQCREDLIALLTYALDDWNDGFLSGESGMYELARRKLEEMKYGITADTQE